MIDWLGLEQVATVEEKPGIRPSPGHVAKVLKRMRGKGARLIIQEEFYPRNTSRTLTKLAKGALIVLRGGTHFEHAETYAQHAQEVADALYSALTE